MSKRARIIAFVSFIQSTLFFTHFFIYKTWTFAAAKNGTTALWLKVTVGALSVSFLAASPLAFRYSNRTVRTLYRIATVWLGIVSILIFAVVLHLEGVVLMTLTTVLDMSCSLISG